MASPMKSGAYDAFADGYFPMIDIEVEPPGDLGLPRYGDRFMLAAVDLEPLSAVLISFAVDGPSFRGHQTAVDELLAPLEFVE